MLRFQFDSRHDLGRSGLFCSLFVHQDPRDGAKVRPLLGDLGVRCGVFPGNGRLCNAYGLCPSIETDQQSFCRHRNDRFIDGLSDQRHLSPAPGNIGLPDQRESGLRLSREPPLGPKLGVWNVSRPLAKFCEILGRRFVKRCAPLLSRPSHMQLASQFLGVDVRVHHLPVQVENVIVTVVQLHPHPGRALDKNLTRGGEFPVDPLNKQP